jgi:tRNA modification GTPase
MRHENPNSLLRNPRIPEETIAAIATPPGEGAIGIVRLSGSRAIAIASARFVSSQGADIRASGRRVFHGEFRDGDGTIDEVLVHVMRAPHSYTREDVVEINCHGGSGPVYGVLEAVLALGARLAEPGEFTKRAFLNGRIDLVQAEAVIDRIRAGTRAALRAAAAAAGGALSCAIREMQEALAGALARVEASVDFPEEDLPELVDDALRDALRGVHARIGSLLDTARAGRLYREGARIAIAGRPNVGKSSLFNALVRDARAIVTAHPGTTRDRLEEIITIRGIPVRLSDTAGLRHTADEVERIGIDVAWETLQTADAVLFVADASQPVTGEDETLAGDVGELDVPAVLVLNKIDLAPGTPPPSAAAPFVASCAVSALTGEGLQALEDTLGDLILGDASISPEQSMVTRIHQRDSLRRASEALARLLDNFNASPEFLSIDLRDALDALGEVTGETTSEDVLDRVFSSFCIGK